MSDNNFKSQYGQDKILLELIGYKRNGFFVELGACDGIMYSNTYYFEKELGWNGILIEPNPNFSDDLRKNRNCYISNEICSLTANENIDFLIAGAVSGVINDNPGYWVKKNIETSQSIKLISTTLSDILDKYNAPSTIDILSLDVEGLEYDILKSFPFDKYKFNYICVEHNSCFEGIENKNKIQKILTNNNYTLIKEIDIDDIYKNNTC